MPGLDLIGGRNDDVLTGGARNDRIDGGGGDDTLAGGGGDDEIEGGTGDDTLSGGAGSDTLVGGAGNDNLDGGAGRDMLLGGTGNDTLTGGTGDDEIHAGDGNDVVLWSAGDGNDDVRGGAGTDTFVLTTSDTAQQTVRIDKSPSGRLIVTVSGPGGGVIVLNSIEELKFVAGLGGARIVVGSGVVLPPLAIGGSDGANVIDQSGTTQRAVIDAGGGNDVVLAGDAVDTIGGGDGNDVIDGGGGADAIDAGSGDDRLVWAVGDGDDTMQGGAGVDELAVTLGSASASTLAVTADAAGNVILATGGGERLTVDGVENIVINAAAAGANVTIGNLAGTDVAQDTIYFVGGAAADTLNASATAHSVDAQGNGGNDTLVSGSGDDVLDGGDGNDTLASGAGLDTVLGGAGNDAVSFTLGDDYDGTSFDSVDGGADVDQLTVDVTSGASSLAIIGTPGGSVAIGASGAGVAETLLVANVETIAISSAGAPIYSIASLTGTGVTSLSIAAGAAADTIDATTAGVAVSLAGNAGADILRGSSQADVLAGGADNDTLVGNAGADLIDGGAGDDSIIGGAGNDALTGGAGNDRYFVVDPGQATINIGQDTITDFLPGDVIDLTAVAGVWLLSQVLALARQEGADTVIDFGGGNALRLAGVSVGSLTAASFVFGAPPAPIMGTPGFDNLNGTPGNDLIVGLGGNDFLTGMGGSDVLDGGDGSDVAFYQSNPGPIVANLSAAPITVGGLVVQSNTVRDAAGAVDTLLSVENIVGTAQGDTLIGGAESNGFTGAAGADTISGGEGNDIINGGPDIDSLDGGAGFDSLAFGGDLSSFNAPTLTITVNPDGSITSFNALTGETETAANFELVTGSLGDDTVTGGAGNDFLGGGFGSDTINGGAGIDTVFYGFNPGAVQTIDLATGTSAETLVQGGIVLTAADTLLGIENVRGGQSGESIFGNSGNNILEGGLGNDLLRGNAGNDTLHGGASLLLPNPESIVPVGVDGSDTVDYSTDPNAVAVNLLTGVASDGFGGTDTLLSIENANGSAFNDTITGNDAVNVLAGLGGNDTLLGNAGADVIGGGDGNDSITGGAGNDTLTGGAGNDRYLIVDPGQTTVNIGQDTITDFAPSDVIDLTPIASMRSLADVQAVSRQEATDTVIDLGGGNSIRLTGVALGSLTAANFILNAPPPPIVGTPNADVLTGTPGNDTILGLGGNDSLTGLGGSDLLDGGDGNDNASYFADLSPIIANLSAAPIVIGGVTVQPGTVRDAAGNVDTLISIEGVLATNQADTLIGSAGSDTLSGSGGADTINGADGNDLIIGGAGIDALDGGTGFDLVFFSGDPAVLNAPLLQITINADGSVTSVNPTRGETETAIVNFEMVLGSLGNDTVTGNAGNNFLGGSFGSDVINGGAGIDTAVYTFNPGSVLTIDLALGTSSETFTGQAGPPGSPPLTFTAADTLISIENVRGSAGGENIYGNAADNVLEGLAGNDVLRGGAGNDTLNGGASVLLSHPEAVIPVDQDGTDTVDYSTDPSAVTINLLTGVATDGFGGTDTLISIENANGSAFNDTITGNDAANVLAGLGGNDTLVGNAGADVISGGDGNDSITGGAGNDTLTGGVGNDRYVIVDPGQTTVNIGQDTITDFAAGIDLIDLTPITTIRSLADVQAVSRQEGADTIIDLGGGNSIRLTGFAVGNLNATSFLFAPPPGFPPGSIVGTANNDGLQGTGGADFLFGLGGNDTLIGNAGNDTLDGGDGTDVALYLNDTGPFIGNLSDAPITVGAITVQPNTVRDGSGNVDTLISVEGILLLAVSGNFADTLIGNAGANSLSSGPGEDTVLGGDGADIITGGSGIDFLDGGAGFDVVSFGGDASILGQPNLNITVNADGSVRSVNQQNQIESTIFNFEMVIGSSGNDTITGNSGNNFLGGGIGSDVINGGAGIDTVVYHLNQGTVFFIDLAAGTSSKNNVVPGIPPPGVVLAAADTLIDIENVRGSVGNDNIFGNAGDNVIEGFSGNDLLRGGAGNDTLDGGASTLLTHPEGILARAVDGTDTADYATDIAGVTVNLATGVAQDGFGGTDTLVSIENATGSAFADMLTGDDGANVLAGLAGADTLNGGAGDDRLVGGTGIDVIDGGAGFDTVDYSADGIAASAPGLAITIAGTTVTAVNAALGQSEIATNVEAVAGSAGNDVVTGDGGDNTFFSGGGADQFDAGAGTDTLGFDTAAVVDLEAGTAQTAGGTVAFTSVENATGSGSADTLRGDAGANVLIGGLGDDVLVGRGGADTLIGGTPGVVSTDVDTADYSSDAGPVVVNLATGFATDGSGATDTLIGIERVVGSSFADALTGDGANNLLTGLGGDDTLTGGAGADTFVATASGGNDVVTDFNVAQDVVHLRALGIRSFADVQAMLSQVGADTVIRFDAANSVRLLNVTASSLTANNFAVLNQTIIGTAAAETLTGDIGDDNIQGLGGNDTLNGLAGNDTLDGGIGIDTLNGGPGNDTLLDTDNNARMNGGPGNDTFNGTPNYAADPSGIIANLSAAPLDVNGNGSLVLAARTVRDGYGDTDLVNASVLRIEASPFDDQIVGSAGNDVMVLSAGNDRALGMDGNDTIYGSSGDDYMDGGAGTLDILNYADAVEDTGTASQGIRVNLSGIAADIGGGVVLAANSAVDAFGYRDSVFNFEVVQGTRFDDVIVGSSTTTQINGFDGNDTLLGGSGNENLSGGVGNDVIDGGAGFDSVNYSGGSSSVVVNLLTQTATDGLGGTDVIRNVESITTGQFADQLTGNDNNNSFSANAGDDTLRGNGGDDFLDGGDGNDTLEGGAGSDQLYGGRNNDTLTGGAGQDFFVFVRNPTVNPVLEFGVDVITDFSVADDWLNVSQVPELTSLNAVLARATANAQGVLIQVNASSSIQLNGLTLADLPQVRFFFAPIAGTAGDDVLDGTAAGEQINGFAGNDVINGREGSDSLDGGDGNDTLNGGADGDQLFGGFGNDALNGEAGNDFMDGGSGDDTLTGGGGSDTFRSSTTGVGGPGRDVFTDFSVAEDRLDLSAFAGMTSRDALAAAAVQAGPDVIITIDAATSVTLRNLTLAQLAAANVTFAPFTGTPGNDVINGSSGADTINGLGGDDTISGNAGNDNLFGGDGNDTINGGAGFDTVDGGPGNDTLVGGADSDFFGTGGGHDVIADFDGDILNLNPFASLTTRSAVMAAASQVGDDVVIAIDAANSITLRNFTLAELAVTSMALSPLNGTEGNDVLNGSDDFETINGFGGDDVINGNGGSDNLFGGAGNDTINGGAGGDFITGGEGNDTLSGGADSDSLEGGNGNDTLTGGAATDYFQAGVGHDVITDFASDDVLNLTLVPSLRGRDDLLNAASQNGADILIAIDALNSITVRNLTVAQLAAANVSFAPLNGTSGNDTIDGTSGNDVMNGLAGDDLLNGLGGNDSMYGQEGSDTLLGGAGNDYLAGWTGNDILDGGAGDDALYGDAGDDILTGGAGFDTFRWDAFNLSPGNDVITDFTVDDRLDLAAFPSMMSRTALLSAAAQLGSDVIVTLDAQTTVTLRNFTLAALQTANVTFAPFVGTAGNDVLDGSPDGEQMSGLGGDDTLNGNGGFDILYGGSGNDTLNGGADGDYLVGGDGDDDLRGDGGFDTLEGGAGSDRLTGGADTDFFRVGGGQDTVADFDNDVLDLTPIPTMTSRAVLNAAAAQVGADVVITIGASESITIENFTLAQLAAADVRFAPFVGTEGNDSITGSPGNDILQGLGGDDILNGGDGDDQLFGGAGNDTLVGGAGSDSLSPGLGNDTVDGGASLNDYIDFGFNATNGVNVDLGVGLAMNDGTGGIDAISNVEHVYATSFDDTIVGDAGSNQLHGFFGNDTLLGSGGNDSVYGYDGDDTLNGGAGEDLISGMGGDDLFVFGPGDGVDVISGFMAGAGTDDVIDLQALGFASFAAVQEVTDIDGAGNAVIDLGGGNTLTLLGVDPGTLHADDFLL